jgi:hypothetical protein
MKISEGQKILLIFLQLIFEIKSGFVIGAQFHIRCIILNASKIIIVIIPYSLTRPQCTWYKTLKNCLLDENRAWVRIKGLCEEFNSRTRARLFEQKNLYA